MPVRRGIEVRKVDLESQEEKGTQRSRVSAGGWERYPKLSLPNNIHHLMIVMLNERAMLGV